ncbi:MAG: hypothetical protein II013_02935 [Lachnobacterium sp.]|nr:hypothetical protein [Lachnobacterium sp.]
MKNIKKKLFILAMFLSIINVPEGIVDASTLSIDVPKEKINKGDRFTISLTMFDGASSYVELDFDEEIIKLESKNRVTKEKGVGKVVLDVENERKKGSTEMLLDFVAKRSGVTTVKACAFSSKDKSGKDKAINAAAKTVYVENAKTLYEENDENNDENNLEYDEKKILFYGNNSYEIESIIPSKIIPKDFIQTTIRIDNKEYAALENYKLGIKLLYLKKQIFGLNNLKKVKNDPALFIYDEDRKEIFPFLEIYTEDESIIPTFIEKADIPKKYFEREIVIKNQKIKVLASNYDEFCLVYCYNGNGSRGWYKYNVSEGKFMKYVKSLSAERFFDSKVGKEVINIVGKNVTKAKLNNYHYFMIGACLLFLFNILVKIKKNNRLKKQIMCMNYFSIEEQSVDDVFHNYEYSKKDLQSVKDKDEFERESRSLIKNSDLEFIDGK